MIPAEMLTLRTVLADRRHSLLDRLASAAAGENLTGGQGIEPGFLRLLADTHTAIAALDAALAEADTTNGD
jgi:hypothetical protein